MSMGKHQSVRMKSDDWLTPPELIRRLGLFDLDPCCPKLMPWSTAKRQFTKADDGLAQPWEGRVWLNPPYSREATKWLAKMAAHKNGIALTFARTETRWFVQHVWKASVACLFIYGRLHFHRLDGSRAPANAGAPSVLVAYDRYSAGILWAQSDLGKYLNLE